MTKFEYQYDELSPKVTVELDSDSSLGEILSSFESFLRAAGFVFSGEIDIVNEEVNGNVENEVN